MIPFLRFMAIFELSFQIGMIAVTWIMGLFIKLDTTILNNMIYTSLIPVLVAILYFVAKSK